MTATATAAAVKADAAICVLPLTIPDRWKEKSCGAPTCTFSPTDSFDAYDKKGVPVANPDEYIGPGKAGYTGYDGDKDKGVRITLKNNNKTSKR